MFKIIHKQIIAEGIKRLDIAAGHVASRVFPGQFVMVTPVEGVKSIPMTVVDWDERKGSISLIVHEVGTVSGLLGGMGIGDDIFSIVGPLGKPAVIEQYGLVAAVATGIGAAQILPICRALKRRGNKVIGIIGAKSKNVLMLEAQMRVVCDDIFITTNDGSYERKGLASHVLGELINKMPLKAVYAIGSVEMMKNAVMLAGLKALPVWVTLNGYMTNGLGMCGSCRLFIDGKQQLICSDGPQFDGTKVDFNDLALRMQGIEGQWKQTNHINRQPGALATYVKSLLAWSKK